jgi:transglutaminase/protease-like cytokinesis protein 3
MKLLAGLLVLFFTSTSVSQVRNNNFFAVNWSVQSVPVTPEALAKKLTGFYATELEKTTAIFRWITENISYRPKIRNGTRNAKLKQYVVDEIEDNAPLKPLTERVAENVLRERVAVCDGYARLFKTLCDYAGIRSEIITGYARTGFGNVGDRFKSNHTWNAVSIDSNWHLIDATWASGYFTYNSDEFIKHYNNYYFLTPPEDFIKDHFPEDIKWTLLTDPPTLKEFERSPFKAQAFIKSKILSYKPAKGIINVLPGDSILIEIETPNVDKNLVVSPTVSFDSSGYLIDTAFTAVQKPLNKIVGNKISHVYPVQFEKLGWLHIILNGEVVLLYKLNNKKDHTAKNIDKLTQ